MRKVVEGRRSLLDEQIQTENMRLNIQAYVREQQAQGFTVCDMLIKYVAALELAAISGYSSAIELEDKHATS